MFPFALFTAKCFIKADVKYKSLLQYQRLIRQPTFDLLILTYRLSDQCLRDDHFPFKHIHVLTKFQCLELHLSQPMNGVTKNLPSSVILHVPQSQWLERLPPSQPLTAALTDNLPSSLIMRIPTTPLTEDFSFVTASGIFGQTVLIKHLPPSLILRLSIIVGF